MRRDDTVCRQRKWVTVPIYLFLTIVPTHIFAQGEAEPRTPQANGTSLIFRDKAHWRMSEDDVRDVLETLEQHPADSQYRIRIIRHFYAMKDAEQFVLHSRKLIEHAASSVDAVTFGLDFGDHFGFGPTLDGAFTTTARTELIDLWADRARRDPDDARIKEGLLHFAGIARPELSSRLFPELLELKPLHPLVLQNYGLFLWRIGDLQAAARILSNENTQDSLVVPYVLSMACEKLGQFNEARRAAERLRSKSQQGSRTESAGWEQVALFQLASISLSENRIADARDAIERAISLARDARGRRNFGIVPIPDDRIELIERFAIAASSEQALAIVDAAIRIHPTKRP